jgi:hypothetical protein
MAIQSVTPPTVAVVGLPNFADRLLCEQYNEDARRLKLHNVCHKTNQINYYAAIR